MYSAVHAAATLVQQQTTRDAACADTATQQLSKCRSITRATLSSVTGQIETPFLLLLLHFVASPIGLMSTLLDSGALHNFISSKLVHEIQEQGTLLEIWSCKLVV